MKIGLVLDDTLDTPDGVQQYVLSIGTWLSEQGHEVHYLLGETKRTDIANLHSLSRNLRVRFNGNRMSMPLPASRRKLRALLRQEQFDVLHVQVPYSPFMAGKLLKLAPRSTAIVGTFHVLPYGSLERLANRFLAIVTSRSSRRFQAMIAASQPAADFAMAYYGFQTQVIPHPFDYNRFASATAAPNGSVNIVYLARLVERKGAAWLLRAVDELYRTDGWPAEAHVIIGGKGPLLDSLKRYVHDNKLEDIVTFSGFVTEADKPAFLAQADIAVFPSTSGESFGISVIEGLAAARGVVLGGDNPGYRAAMQLDDQLIRPTKVHEFASILAKWLADPAARDAAARKQRQIASMYDRDVIGRKVLDVYEQALQATRQS